MKRSTRVWVEAHVTMIAEKHIKMGLLKTLTLTLNINLDGGDE